LYKILIKSLQKFLVYFVYFYGNNGEMDISDAINLEKRISKLVKSFKLLEQNNADLISELQKKDAKIVELESMLEHIKEDYNNIVISKSIEASAKENYDAEKEIKILVREIDKCIALLNT